MSDFLNYIIRSLLSEGRVRYETVEKTKSGLKPRLIEREGPTGLIMTTTAVTLHPENETRHLAIPVSDTPAQTKRILRAIASAHDGSENHRPPEDLQRWQALQTWIDCANHQVIVPFAGALSDLIPPVAVRLRRDFTAILNLTEAHAILHQASRRLDDHGRVVATLEDYRAVRGLVKEIVSEGVDQAVSETIRQTVEAVGQICSDNAADVEHPPEEKYDPYAATVLQVTKALAIDRSSASRRVKQALARGYLKNVEPRRGRAHRLVIGDPLPEEEQVMPTSEKVRARWKQKSKQ
jgi:hypothetical protein